MTFATLFSLNLINLSYPAQRLFCFYTATRGWQESAVLLFVQTIQQVPDAEHVLDTQRTVILAVAGAAVAGAFLPQLAAVVCLLYTSDAADELASV